ncbi:MAG: hypothetical protein LCH61_17120 [Proteobacteria bacterium]|nr:hypothetical protein [Pseudomonadota bacterium]
MFTRDTSITAALPVYRANGTVMAADVEALYTDAPARSMIVVDPDFDGYMAELSRGLNTILARTGTGVKKIAVILNADSLDEAELGGLSTNGASLRAFPRGETQAALAWAQD